ncbi:hypothetical protein JYT74_00460 [Crocinitomix catalasitica]|nr:hypothetical protein [Crocinitomix catalasitica]
MGLLIIALSFLPALAQVDTLKVNGKISTYPIEMEILSSDWERGTFAGRYKYSGKDSYLMLKGEVLGQYIIMYEYYKGEQTGSFYLERSGGDSLMGMWTSATKAFDVELIIGKKEGKKLSAKSLRDYSKETNSDITGSYGIEEYFWNDMWFTDEKPELEIGFNGGYALVEKIDDKSLRFQVEVVVGPTYHLAFASGVARKKGNKYVYEEWMIDEVCQVTITFGEKLVIMSASNSFECGFGARAHLEHEFVKVSDEVEFKMDTSLEKIKDVK